MALRTVLCTLVFVWVSIASALTGVVKTDGALVYSKPDFDAEVLTTLSLGQTIVVSKGTTGDFAKFHRMRAGPVIGFIAEIDVDIDAGSSTAATSAGGKSSAKAKTGKSKSSAKSSAKSKKASNKSKLSPAQQEARQKEIEEKRRKARAALPFVFNRYIGVVVGVAEYEETFNGSTKKESLLIYGLKATGPDLLFPGPILDLNLLLHYGAPKGYADISTTKPSGFFILADALLVLPALHGGDFLGSLGVGPLLSYRNFKTVDASGFVTHSGFSLGLSLEAGAGYRVGDYAVRVEAKYLLDKRLDTIFQLSLQNAF